MKFFCNKDVKPFFAIAGFNAGYLVARNNPDLVGRALPVADGILTALKGGTPNDALNALFKEAVLDLVGADPLIQANMVFLLSMVSFDLNAPGLPAFSVPEIEAMVTNFKVGAAAVK